MDELENEGHMKKQLRKNSPRHEQRCMLSYQDEIILQIPPQGIETSCEQISNVSSLKGKTQRKHERGLKMNEFLKKMKVLNDKAKGKDISKQA